MRNLCLYVLILTTVGCTGLQTISGGAVNLSRTEELLMAGYTVEEINRAESLGYYSRLVNQARSSGKVEKGYQEWISGVAKPEYEKYVKAKNIERYEQMAAKREQQIQIQKNIEQQQLDRLIAFIDGKKSICKAYGFTEENAIASCVQTEINNEITRLQQQQVYANAQARANAQSRANAFSNMGRCLSNEASFAACGNAWSGYTPKPAKKVYKCDYDVFGNQISSTCREQ